MKTRTTKTGSDESPSPLDPSRRRWLVASAAVAAAAALPSITTRALARPPSSTRERNLDMSSITTKDGTEIFYKDWGKGQPIVFHHGWPLSSDDWDAQMLFFVQQGFRVVAHDRRGHGRSTQTADGNDMDTYAADVAALAEKLDLRTARAASPSSC
jgi:non-heme chloroperoxidase